MAKNKLNWQKENDTLSPMWQNLKFHMIRQRFIFRTGVRGGISRSYMESYIVEAQLFYKFIWPFLKIWLNGIYFILAKFAKANWIWLQFFLPLAKMA